MTKQILLYDTTLRDGTQGEGISLSCNDKLKIAKKLDEFGVHYIEGGWPGSNPKDALFFKELAKKNLKNSRIVAFGSTRRADVKPKEDQNLHRAWDASRDHPSQPDYREAGRTVHAGAAPHGTELRLES
jgi:2-isopropylmalate synthase